MKTASSDAVFFCTLEWIVPVRTCWLYKYWSNKFNGTWPSGE